MPKNEPKTRPDLDDEQYLVFLSNAKENRGINVYALYKAMLDWCWKNGKTASRLRLLNWLSREREAIPMTAAPIALPQAARSKGTDHEEPKCSTCKDAGEVPTKPKNAQFDWQVEFIPCPDCSVISVPSVAKK